MIKSGDAVLVQSYDGGWHEAVATSPVEPTHRGLRKVHDFPVVWVKIGNDGDSIPWPAQYVERIEDE